MGKLNITPAPWHVMRGDVLDQNGRMVAAVDSADTDDASLIAAAPELLESLQKYMSAVEQMNEAMSDGYYVQGAMSELVGAEDIAKAAIAKALGK